MFQQTQGIAGEYAIKWKGEKLYNEFNINIARFDDIKQNNNDSVFELKFTGKNGDNNGKIYHKIYSNNDLNHIKAKAVISNVNNNELIDTILYCLSKNNDKYNVKYIIINNENKGNHLFICIEYKAGMISFNIELKIPGKLCGIDVIKRELKKTRESIDEKNNEINSLKQKLIKIQANDQAKTKKINDLQQQLNKLKSDLKLNRNTNEINVLKQELNKIRTNQKTKIDDFSGLTNTVNNIKWKDIATLKEELNEMKTNLKSKAQELKTIKLNANTKKYEIMNLKQELTKVISNADVKSTEISKLKQQVKDIEGKFEPEIKQNNDNSLCPAELNKNPVLWTANDVKVWVRTLPKELQKDGLKIAELGLNGFKLTLMNANNLFCIGISTHHVRIKREFDAWLPNAQNGWHTNRKYDWSKVKFEIGQSIEVFDVCDNSYKSAKVIQVFNNGIKVCIVKSLDSVFNLIKAVVNGYPHEWNQLIYKIHYKNRIKHPDTIYEQYINVGRVIVLKENNYTVWARIQKIIDYGCEVKTNFGSKNGITKDVFHNEYKNITITDVVLANYQNINLTNNIKANIRVYSTDEIQLDREIRVYQSNNNHFYPITNTNNYSTKWYHHQTLNVNNYRDWIKFTPIKCGNNNNNFDTINTNPSTDHNKFNYNNRRKINKKYDTLPNPYKF